MGEKKPLSHSNRYTQFIRDRDKTLEQIHLNAQTDVSRLLFDTLDQIETAVARLVLRSFQSPFSLANSLETQTLDLFSQLIYPIVSRIQLMRKASYVLSHFGELEAIGRATQKQNSQMRYEFKQKVDNAVEAKTLTGQILTNRIWASLMKLRDQINSRFRLALIQELSPEEILASVKDAFPKIQTYIRPPRELKPLKEAAFDPKEKKEFTFDFLDQDDWNLVQQSYQDTELPPSRFDSESLMDLDKGYARYNWEIEQEMTNDFVNQVRQGQVDAANELGIQEFVWVAVLDNKTDECCAERNGMTTSEIEDAIDSGKLDSDLCDAVTPPAHPNCRCTLAPVASIKEVEGPDWKSFNEWINS